MKANKKIFLSSILLSSFFLIGFTYLYLFFSGTLREYILKRKSEPIIEKVEEYKKVKGFYPKKISDAGYPEPDESGPIFYEPKDSNTSYEIFFGMSLGESVTYDSKTKKWFP